MGGGLSDGRGGENSGTFSANLSPGTDTLMSATNRARSAASEMLGSGRVGAGIFSFRLRPGMLTLIGWISETLGSPGRGNGTLGSGTAKLHTRCSLTTAQTRHTMSGYAGQ